MLDADIRFALLDRLTRTYDGRDARIWPEMAIGLGASRVDVAVINGNISGFEIKSERDSLSRLPSQVTHYGRCLDYASVVVSGRHTNTIAEALPGWWGIYIAAPNVRRSEVVITQRRRPRKNPDLDAFYVAQLLWRDEALAILKAHDAHARLQRATRWQLWDALVERLSLSILRKEVRTALIGRELYSTR